MSDHTDIDPFNPGNCSCGDCIGFRGGAPGARRGRGVGATDVAPSSNPSPVCPHGSLRRQCEVCERDEEIARLRAAMARAHGIIRKCVTAGVLRADLNRFLADEADYAGPSDETSELSRALHVIDEAGKLSDWINRARPVITELMEAYARLVRSHSGMGAMELAEVQPWRCMEYIGAEQLLRDQPVAVVEIPAVKAVGGHTLTQSEREAMDRALWRSVKIVDDGSENGDE